MAKPDSTGISRMRPTSSPVPPLRRKALTKMRQRSHAIAANCSRVWVAVQGAESVRVASGIMGLFSLKLVNDPGRLLDAGKRQPTGLHGSPHLEPDEVHAEALSLIVSQP